MWAWFRQEVPQVRLQERCCVAEEKLCRSGDVTVTEKQLELQRKWGHLNPLDSLRHHVSVMHSDERNVHSGHLPQVSGPHTWQSRDVSIYLPASPYGRNASHTPTQIITLIRIHGHAPLHIRWRPYMCSHAPYTLGHAPYMQTDQTLKSISTQICLIIYTFPVVVLCLWIVIHYKVSCCALNQFHSLWKKNKKKQVTNYAWTLWLDYVKNS